MATPSDRLAGFAGPVLVPGDDGYEEVRRVWNGMVDRRPAIIARCTSSSDVAIAVRAGRSLGLEIGVRGGGHSVLGLGLPDGGLMIDLSLMDRVRVDPDRRVAWVQGGALLGALDRAAQPSGLATTAGNVSHTGVGGLTLGGGMGWLARKLGLACDNVVTFEVVSADGDLVRVSASENPDLFWGLRGGGGNFGVVTEFAFRLHQVGTTALVANLFYSPADASKAMRRWRDLLPEMPAQATPTAWAGTAGDSPNLPPELRNQPLVSIGYVWVGDPDTGSGLVRALRDAATPAGEQVATLPYIELQSIEDDLQRHRLRRYWKGHYLRALDDEAIDAFVSRGASTSDGDRAFWASGSLQGYGGAIAAVGPDETAFSHRDTLVEFIAAAKWIDPAEDEARLAAARRYGAAMEPFASGVYVNALGDEGQAGVRRAYGAQKLARLTALKDRYDPNNVFRLNHNIRPSRDT